MARLGFNVEQVPDNDYSPILDGEYAAQIIKSEMKDTKAGTGQYLELRVQILEPPYNGRIVFDRLNLINPNQVAVSIANRTLADICTALGITEIEDSEELHNQELTVRIATEERDGYPPSNVIKKYLPANFR